VEVEVEVGCWIEMRRRRRERRGEEMAVVKYICSSRSLGWRSKVR
jgi:hypothetical protein